MILKRQILFLYNLKLSSLLTLLAKLTLNAKPLVLCVGAGKGP